MVCMLQMSDVTGALAKNSVIQSASEESRGNETTNIYAPDKFFIRSHLYKS